MIHYSDMGDLRIRPIQKYIASIAKYFSGGSLTSKAYLNTFATFLDYVSQILVGLITNPIIVSLLGIHLYGVWQFLTRWSSYTTLMGGRPSVALRWKIANLQESADVSEKRRAFGSAVVVWLGFLPVFILVGGLIAWFTPLWLHTQIEFYRAIRIAIVLLLSGNLITGIAELPRYILQGENKAYKRIGIRTVISLAGGLLAVLVLFFGAGIVGMAGVYSFMILADGVLFLLIARKFIHWFGLDWPTLQEVKSYFSLNWWYMGWFIVYQLLITSDLIVLGFLVSPSVLGIYSLNKYAPEVAISIVIMILSGITPGMGKFIGQKDFVKVSSLRNEIFAITWLVGLSISSVAIIWSRSFVSLWVGSDKFVGFLPSILIIMKVFQFILLITDSSILDVTLKVKGKVILGGISLVVSILFSILFIRYLDLGITGLCLGFLIGQSILTVGYPWIVMRYLQSTISNQWAHILRPAGISLVTFAISIFLGIRIYVENWIFLVLLGGLTFVVILIIAYSYGLPVDMREQLRSRFPQFSLSHQ